MFRWASLRIGRIGPIEINIHATWLVIFGLLVYWLRTGYIVENAPDLKASTSWTVAAISALLLFVSVLAHELSHSFVGLRYGLPIRKITLFIFGGVAHMEEEPKSPGVEFRMALAGPVASLAIATVAGLIRFVFVDFEDGSPTGLVLQYVTYANGMLAIFNLVPGFPLDGGRVLRSVLWKLTGNFVRATKAAAAVGRIFGLTLVFIGVTLSVAVEAPGFLWLAFIGTFIERLAYFGSYRVSRMAEGVKVGSLMTREIKTVPGDKSLWDAAREYFITGYNAYPVKEDDRITGILSRADIASVPRDEWDTTRVAEAMTPWERVVVALPAESARVAFGRMLQTGVGRMIVVEDGRMVGIITRTDLMIALSGGRR
jgi:Zn-dependent protease/predicted transcriptional regulator